MFRFLARLFSRTKYIEGVFGPVPIRQCTCEVPDFHIENIFGIPVPYRYVEEEIGG